MYGVKYVFFVLECAISATAELLVNCMLYLVSLYDIQTLYK